MDETPLTERSSDITRSIDTAIPQDIVRMLHKCDKQIFDGYLQYDNVLTISDKLDTIKDEIVNILRGGDESCIVLSGCGTSGRLGFLTSQSFNRVLKQTYSREAKLKYLLAGGDEGLFVSKELIEDDPKAGLQDLLEVTKDKTRVLYIGITCGLSAPYVAGQLEYAYNHPEKFYPVLMGFNPTNLARDLPIENWDKTFRQVVHEFMEADCGTILTPVYGPEPITGSSRMKGGTTTKILLDTLFTCAVMETFERHPNVNVRSILESYKPIQDTVFAEQEQIVLGIEQAGRSLSNGGHVYYVSDNAVGALGLIDASECPPTYGSAVNDVRGFIEGGFESLDTNDGDGSAILEISTSFFKTNILPKLTENDTVFILQSCKSLKDALTLTKATMTCITTTSDNANKEPGAADSIRITLPILSVTKMIGNQYQRAMDQFHAEIAIKWVCNSLTTGAHILKGKVFENYMIDVKVRNDKLYRRALSIIQKFAEVSVDRAEECLLKVVNDADNLTEEHKEAPISENVKKATNMEQAVPLSIVMAKRRCGLVEAKRIVSEHPAIRKVLSTNLLL